MGASSTAPRNRSGACPRAQARHTPVTRLAPSCLSASPLACSRYAQCVGTQLPKLAPSSSSGGAEKRRSPHNVHSLAQCPRTASGRPARAHSSRGSTTASDRWRLAATRAAPTQGRTSGTRDLAVPGASTPRWRPPSHSRWAVPPGGTCSGGGDSAAHFHAQSDGRQEGAVPSKEAEEGLTGALWCLARRHRRIGGHGGPACSVVRSGNAVVRASYEPCR